MLLTLADAYAEAGDFDKSSEFAQQAKTALPEDASQEVRVQLAQLENKEALKID